MFAGEGEVSSGKAGPQGVGRGAWAWAWGVWLGEWGGTEMHGPSMVGFVFANH